jgi:formylglycine-generating enzyme required for sulfatase activity
MKRYISLLFISLATCLLLIGCSSDGLFSPTITQTPSPTATRTSTITVTFPPTFTSTFTPSYTPTLASGATRVSEKDGMVMVYVPAGDFTMGFNDAGTDEKPAHTVFLDTYWIDRTEVTNGMYALCVQAGTCKPPGSLNSNLHSDYYGTSQYADYPVIQVDWMAAQAYCGWAGRSLPTEAQWEKAARGPDDRFYPWGNTSPNCSLANYWGTTFACVGDTTAVGGYQSGASPYGALDMAGNVWEWVADWYDASYYMNSPSSNPQGPASGTDRILRGGSWYFDGYRTRSTYRYRYSPGLRGDSIGFRCASSAP